jgi:Hint domain
MTTITSSSTIGIYLSSPSYTNPVVINSDVFISSTTDGISAATGFWTIENYGRIAGGVFPGVGINLKAGGSVTNAADASIIGYGGVKISGGSGTLVNDGFIASTGTSWYGVYLKSGGLITNASSGTISGYVAVQVSGGTGTVVNFGSIAGIGNHGFGLGPAGVYLGSGGSVTNATSASITGNLGVWSNGGAVNVVNAGSIGGAETCVDLISGGSVTNQSGASISGYDGISGLGVTVVNYGSIAGTGRIGGIGVYLSSGGSVTNTTSASLTGGDTGVCIRGSAGTLVNDGSIAGTNGWGVELGAGGSVTNAASGTIIGDFAGVFFVDSTGTVVNDGSIGSTNPSGNGVYLDSGGTLTNAGMIAGSGGTAVSFGGTGNNLLVLDPGYGLSGAAVGGASASNALELASAASAGALSRLGTEFVDFQQTTIDAGASWTFNGANTIEAGATLTELNGATLTASGTLVNDGTISIDASTMTAGGLTGIGVTMIDASSTLEVQGTVAGGETLMFAGSGAYLNFDNPGSVAGSVTNFAPGETINLKGVDPGSVTYSGGFLNFNGGSFALSLANPGTVTVSGSEDGASVSVSALCFCTNTLITTPSGERPVQQLAVGDMVTTHRGVARRIVWVGTGKVLATQGRRDAATPIIVCQGALAHNVPNRDLRVTKGHSLYIDGVLIPVEFLVNHRSIFWDDNAQEVELYHIELETHDVLVANGAPAESYRDDGNRWLFRNANSGWGLPPQTPCAPVLTGGPVVDKAWRRLLECAGPRPGVPMTDDPDLHLLVDGRRVDAASRSDEWHIFDLPAPPATVRIISRAGIPQEMGLARDPRSLGVALRQIMVTRGAQIRTIEAEDARLTDGFHGYEAENDIRWTDGDAGVPAALFEGFDGPPQIALCLGGRTSYPDDGTLLRVA